MNKDKPSDTKDEGKINKEKDMKEKGEAKVEQKEENVLCRKKSFKISDLRYVVLDPFTNIFGLVVSLLVLFLFPFKGVSTLMHDVLHLPGPGAGIAFPIGMVLVAFLLASYAISKQELAPFWVAFLFGIIYNLLAPYAGGIPFAPFVNRFIAALLLGLGVSCMLYLLKGKALEIKYFLTGALGNLIYLSLFWVLVFPFGKGWVKPSAVPILSILALCAGLAAALVPYLYARSKRIVI